MKASNCVVLTAFAVVLGGAAAPGPTPTAAVADADRPALAAQVREELLHAWRGYERYAWGHDELKPVSRSAHDWHRESLLMTPVDALDTLLLMGLKDEAARARKLIVEKLSFDKDISVKNFEITIRILGGLLSAYQADRRYASSASRRRPGHPAPAGVFDSPTGMPYMYVNLKTGKTSGARSNPAEIGTLLLEFGTLSKLTGKPVFYEKAKKALVEPLLAPLADRSRRRGDRRRDGGMAQPREPRRRRDRLVLRVPAQVRDSLRRRRLRADVDREPPGPERAPGRRGAVGPLVRPGRHDDGPANGERVRGAPRIPAGRARARGRPRPRPAVAGVVLRDVEPFTASSPRFSTIGRCASCRRATR